MSSQSTDYEPGQTPSQTIGPFFHYGLLFGGENILVNERTAGERIVIVGPVYDGDGVPVSDAMVEIWQPDAQGIFSHPSDPRHEQADPDFRGFGRSDTAPDGQFTFKTVKPGRVPFGRDSCAPYINVRVFARGMLIHAVTRIYFDDEAANADDPVLAAIEPARRATLLARREEFGDLPHYHFDIRLQGEGETVFFDV